MRAIAPFVALAVAIGLGLAYLLVVVPPEGRAVVFVLAGLIGALVAFDAVISFRGSRPAPERLRCRHCGCEVVENRLGWARTQVPYLHADPDRAYSTDAGPHSADPHGETTR